MISVVVPAYNAAGSLGACLRALNQQTIPRNQYQVIVVDDGSTDDTATLAKANGAVVVSQPNQGPAVARNRGVQEAQGELVLFTDSDCEPMPDWIQQLCAPFASPEVAGAKGAYRTRQHELMARFVQLEYEDKYDRLAQQPRIDFVDTYSAAYRREVFVENGGFEPAFSTASVEDQELSFRLSQKGYQLVFAPAAQVYHQHDCSVGEYVRRKFGIGYWKALLVRWHPEKVVRDSHTPQTLKLQIVLLGLLGMALAAWPIWKAAGWGVLGLAAAFMLSTVPFLLKVLRRDPPVLPVALPALTLRALALGAGMAVGYAHFAFRPTPRKPVIGPFNRAAKRLLDVIGALLGLVVAAPLVVLLAILIKLDSPGPVFFRQARVGENGRLFWIIKLRSMVDGAEAQLDEMIDVERLADSPAFKIKDDPRVTRMGRLLRRASLDELPQFWNVLTGDMSLVGPRPEEVRITQLYNDWHRRRLALKPGMTGPMQVNGRGNLPLDERVRLELDYIEHYSLWRDIVILARTLPAIISGRGAY